MPRHRPSEKPKTLVFGPFGPRNLKEVYQYIDFSPTVPDKLRGPGLGALLMLAGLHSALDAEPPLDVLARIPASVQLLRSYLKKAHAKKKKYTDGAWRNMRSSIFTCLRVAGVKARQGRKRVPLPRPFHSFLDQLAEKQKRLLYPFLRWCLEEGLSSFEEITQDVFDRYERFLDEFDGRQRRRAAYTALVRAWRIARKTSSNYPLHEISIVSRRVRYVLPWSAFPELHKEVQSMMDAAQHPDPAFPRRRRRINAATVRHQTAQLRRVASALVHETAIDPAKITSVSQLVQPTAARAALRFLSSRAYERQLSRDRQDNIE